MEDEKYYNKINRLLKEYHSPETDEIHKRISTINKEYDPRIWDQAEIYQFEEEIYAEDWKCEECNGEIHHDRMRLEHTCVECGLVQGKVLVDTVYPEFLIPFLKKKGYSQKQIDNHLNYLRKRTTWRF